jgi:hypothetical protein
MIFRHLQVVSGSRRSRMIVGTQVKQANTADRFIPTERTSDPDDSNYLSLALKRSRRCFATIPLRQHDHEIPIHPGKTRYEFALPNFSIVFSTIFSCILPILRCLVSNVKTVANRRNYVTDYDRFLNVPERLGDQSLLHCVHNTMRDKSVRD